MIDSRDHDEIAELEALLRSARNYVQPSEDLRPRVLEAARVERDQRWLARRVQQLALCLVLLASLTVSFRAPPESPEATTAATGIPTVSRLENVRESDPSWSMVESFTQLRRRQAALLRFDL